jgi:hypothetical protein
VHPRLHVVSTAVLGTRRALPDFHCISILMASVLCMIIAHMHDVLSDRFTVSSRYWTSVY